LKKIIIIACKNGEASGNNPRNFHHLKHEQMLNLQHTLTVARACGLQQFTCVFFVRADNPDRHSSRWHFLTIIYENYVFAPFSNVNNFVRCRNGTHGTSKSPFCF